MPAVLFTRGIESRAIGNNPTHVNAQKQVVGFAFQLPEGKDVYIGTSLDAVLRLIQEEDSRVGKPRQLPPPKIVSLDDLKGLRLTYLRQRVAEIIQGKYEAAYVQYVAEELHPY